MNELKEYICHILAAENHHPDYVQAMEEILAFIKGWEKRHHERGKVL